MWISLRTQPSSDISRVQRNALKLLSEHGPAAIDTRTCFSEGKAFTVHSETALALLRKGYADLTDDQTIEINKAGLRKIGVLKETPSERRRRKAAQDLKAIETGAWRPVPPGASALADKEDSWDREELRKAENHLERTQVRFNNAEFLFKLVQESDWAEPAEVIRCKRERDQAKEDLAKAYDEMKRVKLETQRRHDRARAA